MRVTFWGVRGSITTPEPEYARYGGNTPCVAVVLNDGSDLIFDAGMGFRWLTLDLLSQGPKPSPVSLCLTHCHWDHIQGIPFSPMMYVPGYRVCIYGRGSQGHSLQENILHQMEPAYCPVPNFFLREDVGAHVEISELGDGPVRVGSARLMARSLPRGESDLCTGYRVEDGGKVLAYLSDLEYPKGPASCEEAIELARGADLLIHDAQYLPSEKAGRRGWGHSTFEDAVELARLAGARRVALYHHDPARTDRELDALVLSLQRTETQIFAAREGLQIEL